MKLIEFITEIEEGLSTYAESGDINRVSIKMWVIGELRKFGNNISQVNERLLKVENSKATLPDDFKSLKLALKTDAVGYKIHGNRQNITDSYIYKERIENPAYFDEVNQEYVTTCNPKIITEKITINNTPVDFYYRPQWLSLVKGINKAGLAIDCLNLNPSIRSSYPHQINITNGTINTNFSKGEIYIQYNSLPTDEDGEIIIPEITTGDLYHYLENYVKCKIAEDLIINNKNPQGISQLYSAWKQEQPLLKRAALVETKFAGLPKDWGKNMKIRNKMDFATYVLPSLNFR